MEDKTTIRPWGYHMTLDCGACDIASITDGGHIAAFSRALVSAIEMQAYGDPTVVHFAAHDPTKGGYTLVQLIETPNICAHFVDETGDMYLDVFSCKEFDPNVVMEVVKEWFTPQTAVVNTFVRGVAI